jgi:two-component system, NtrC family, nitrogen regulation sensor histidine kinase NtrY
MSLRRRYILFAITSHAVWLAFSVGLLYINKWYFLGAELLIIISATVTWQLYRAFLKPLGLLAAGIDSITDREFSTIFVETGQEELDRLVSVYNRMIGQLRAERLKQREQHYFLERLIQATPIGIVILDYDERVSMLNVAASDILDVSPEKALGCPLDDVLSGAWREVGRMQSGETAIIRAPGVTTFRCRKSYFLDRGFQRHFIMIEELTREIISMQKRAYDKVIRMMSHETNNSVGAVNSILQTSQAFMRYMPDDDAREFGQAIEVAVSRNRRLGHFMARLADVVRIPPPVMEPVDLHQLLSSVQLLMSGPCGERRIEWKIDFAPQNIIINMDAAQMEQVLVNIFKNAIDAIGTAGTITIHTQADPPELVVTDNGSGIDPETARNLFAPFYSTKSDGQGIGLTLAQEVLTNHGFQFSLETTAPGRTEFRIRFDTNDRSRNTL